jgi:purine-nucleoside phosphorylase
MLRTMGADLIGMSTVLEAIAARHGLVGGEHEGATVGGAEVLGISLVTNVAAGLSDQHLDHHEVLAAGKAAAARMGRLLATVVAKL